MNFDIWSCYLHQGLFSIEPINTHCKNRIKCLIYKEPMIQHVPIRVNWGLSINVEAVLMIITAPALITTKQRIFISMAIVLPQSFSCQLTENNDDDGCFTQTSLKPVLIWARSSNLYTNSIRMITFLEDPALSRRCPSRISSWALKQTKWQKNWPV